MLEKKDKAGSRCHTKYLHAAIINSENYLHHIIPPPSTLLIGYKLFNTIPAAFQVEQQTGMIMDLFF